MSKPRFLLKGLVLIAVFVLLGYLLSDIIDRDWIDRHVRGQGFTGELLFLAVGGLLTAAGLSRQVIAFLAGYAFGFLPGTLLGALAALLGCITAFYVARLLGRRLIGERFSGRIQKIDAFIHDNTFSMTLLIRLLPAGSNFAVNLAAGVSSVRAFPFFAGSGLGYLPQTLIFALIGSGISVDPTLRIGVGAVLFVVSGLIGVYLYRHYRHGRHLDRETEARLGVEDEV